MLDVAYFDFSVAFHTRHGSSYLFFFIFVMCTNHQLSLLQHGPMFFYIKKLSLKNEHISTFPNDQQRRKMYREELMVSHHQTEKKNVTKEKIKN